MILLTITVPLGVISWFALGGLEKRFYQGREIPPRNLPNS
ncbi:Pheophorbide a oxygenase [Crocosphaera watsonii WH 0402]|nr:Pheophorbide a oxygenase [Crocosphaera watsonii WH 0005]CCQ66654.1 Pheophorbide a oxygenase [Crocosphaera watsonii WH 0402]